MLPQSRREDPAPDENVPPGNIENVDAKGSAAERVSTAGAATGEVARAREAGRTPVQREPERRPVTSTQRRVLIFTWLAVFAMCVYSVFMVLAFAAPGYGLVDRIASWFLILGLMFIMMHGLGYANSMIKASWSYDDIKRRAFSPQGLPKVACVIATFNEPLEVLEETVAALTNVDYPNKEVVILDDSTKEEVRQGVRDMAARYGITVRQRTNRRGYKAGAINDFLPTTDCAYVAIFDADALPAHNFLRDIVPIIDENPRLAFVQTPQYYANTESSNVALAAHRQQAVFYEYICEGKSASRAAFCCGTNVVFRREALLAVGGFDETSVTEDFTTSLALHSKGYDSAYYNQVYVYSLGPDTLPAYFTQQSRWSFGSVGAQRRVLKSMITHPGALRLGQWWEYFLSSSYYWIGWVNFVFMLLPMLYIFFGVKPLRVDVFSYLMIFVPYFLFSINMFYMGMEQRGYRVMDMLLGQQINFLCFPVHMTSAIAGILGLRRPFGVTPKATSGRMSWLALWPQLLMMILSAVAFLWGMFLYFSGRDRQTAAIVINSAWALYHFILLSGLFRLNRPLTRTQTSPYFARGTSAQPVAATAGGTATTTGPGLFAPTTAGGRVVTAPPRTTAGAFGRMAFGLMVVSLLVLLAGGVTMAHWYLNPGYPANVYVLDRTTGRDYQEHRALAWTLNFLKVHKQPDFGPEGAQGHQNYNWASDYYGFVPGDPKQAVPDPTHEADLVTYGQDRGLPASLQTPGVLDLADAYGEFVELDYRKEKFIRYRNVPEGVDPKIADKGPPTGITPEDVDKIVDFTKRGGLLIGEWNTIGYPTLPGQPIDRTALAKGIQAGNQGLNDLRTRELPARQAQLVRAQSLYARNHAANAKFLKLAQDQVKETQDKIKNTETSLQQLKVKAKPDVNYDRQLAAQRRLETLLHVHYLNWYGRYVDDFAREHEYDFRMWKNVDAYIRKDLNLVKKYPKGPVGPGFVFYRDGAKDIIDPETHQPEKNPFDTPFVILQDELGAVQTTDIATVNLSQKDGVKDDPLLRGVDATVPCRFWFDVVQAKAGSKVLAWYKMEIKPSAAERLTTQHDPDFPKQYIKTENGRTELVFPAAVAYREGDALKSFYFAGDASDYPLVSRMSEMFPSTGGISYFLGHRFGPFSYQFYWNYYEPILGNIFDESKQVQYKQ